MTQHTIRLENWEVITLPWEMGKHFLHGEVFGHPHVPDGKRIITSALRELCDEQAVTKSGSVYLLGKRKEMSAKAA